MIRYRVIVRDDYGNELENFVVLEEDHAEIIGRILKFLYKHQPCHDVNVTLIDDDDYEIGTMTIG